MRIKNNEPKTLYQGWVRFHPIQKIPKRDFLDGALVVLGHLGLVVVNNMLGDAFTSKTIIDETLNK